MLTPPEQPAAVQPAELPSRRDDPACQVYVGNLPYSLRWQDLKDHMKQAGQCLDARILTVDGTDWGRSRGVGIVRYESEEEAQAAISQLNGSELQGRAIVVDVWTGSSGKWQQERAERIQNVDAAAAVDQAKPGDWICPMCKDLQFARNTSCRTCGAGGGGKGKSQETVELANGQVARPGDWICPFCNDLQFARNAMCRNCNGGKGGYSKGGNGKGGRGKGGAGFGKGFGRGNQVHGENLVYIGNLSYDVSWQDLKDHMKQAGTVEFCSVLTEDGTDYGRSKGAGCVRFSTEEEVLQAIATLAETELKGRRILVNRWSGGKGCGK